MPLKYNSVLPKYAKFVSNDYPTGVKVKRIIFNGVEVWHSPYSLSNDWVFESIIPSSTFEGSGRYDIEFTSNGVEFIALEWDDGVLFYINNQSETGNSESRFGVFDGSTWRMGQEYRTISFVRKTEVADSFYYYVTSYAKNSCDTHSYELVYTKPATCTETGYHEDICSVCGGYRKTTIASLGHLYSISIIDPTCTAQGYTLHSCSRCNYSYKDNYKSALGHTWNDATCTTPKTCSVCGATEGSALGHTWNAATCTTPKTCSVCGVTEGSALGHTWNATTYSWNSNNTECTATRTCKNNSAHIETCTSDVTSQVTKEPTCTGTGTRTYYAQTFTKSWASKQTKNVSIPATGHDWNDTTYSWSGDNSTCTATRTCKNDVSHSETETVNSTNAVTTAATCTTDGVRTYTATFSKSWATKQTTTSAIPATGHNWNTPTYSWNGTSSCTATRTCRNGTHPEYLDAYSVTSQVTQEPTCTATGTRTYYAKFNQTWASQQTKTESIPATGHDWNNTTYSWSSDKSTCTATRICRNDSNHKETETVNSTSSVTTAATCTTTGVRTYTADFTKSWAAKQTTTVAIPATGHDWNTTTYSWNSDLTKCTATRTCKNNSSHVETCTSDVTSQVTKEPTCTATGTRTYYAQTFTKSWAANQTKTETIPATGHSWSVSYSWNSDKSKCTATRTCQNANHPETETVNSTNAVTTAATCTTAGVRTYTANFTKSWATDQTTTVSIPATGHPYGTTRYTWNSNNTECTATRTCANDASHVESKGTTNITSQVTKEPTCTGTGIRTYYATFSGVDWATKQTKNVTIPATGHTWNAATCTIPKTCSVCGATEGSALGHTWVLATCTKPKTCSVCGATEGSALGHRWGDLQTILSATCTADGSGRKTCTICGTVDNDIVIPALGHSYGTPTYSWNGYSSCTATRTCGNNSSHKETATATITSAITTQPTCTTSGTRTYTATFSESWAATQTKTEAISAIGHDYGTPSYSWDDGDVCQGSRTCKRSGCGHVQYSSASIDDGSITFAITKRATCTSTGTMTYTATFPDFGNTTSTYTEVIPKIDHTWVPSSGITPKKCSVCNLQADYVTVEFKKKYNVTAPSGVVDMTGTWTGRAGSSGTFEARNLNTGTSFVFESAIKAISGGGSTAGTNAVVLDTTIGDATLEDNITTLPLTGMYTANIILTGATSATEVVAAQTCTLQVNANYACADVTVTYMKGGVSTTTVIPEDTIVNLEVDCNTSITISCPAGIYFTYSPWGNGSWFSNPFTTTTPSEPGTYEISFDNS